jgi:hypothetical protein
VRFQVVLPPGGEKSGAMLGSVGQFDIEPHCGVQGIWIITNNSEGICFQTVASNDKGITV